MRFKGFKNNVRVSTTTGGGRKYTLLLALVAVLLALLAGTASVGDLAAQSPPLGAVVIEVGNSDSNYGFAAGSYGTLVSGEWPGELFADGNARTVAGAAEDGDGHWRWEYSGGAANGWLTDQEALDAITVTVTYADGRDTRSFVLGGFIEARPGDRGLTLDPPLPSRDWIGKDGQEVVIEFRRHQAQAAPLVLPVAMTDPPAAMLTSPHTQWQGSWATLINMTPGGPLGAQLLLTIVISMGLIWKARTAQDVLIGAAAMVLIPGLMAAFSVGDWLMVSITAVSIASGALVHKAVVAGR